MKKKGNPFLNFIWLDKSRRAKNFYALLSLIIVLSALVMGFINDKLELMETAEDIKSGGSITVTLPEQQVTEQTVTEEPEIGEEEFLQQMEHAESINEFLYNWANNGMMPYRDSNVINVLLIGIDSATGLTGGGRSDTLILLSLNKLTKTINMVSLFRDTWCNIDGTERYGKINSSYSRGGADCLIGTIENNFKIDIDYYVAVDFSTFEDIIDELGGLTVQVQQYEAEYINRVHKLNIPYGDSVTLDGYEALIFARVRKCDSDSDVSRTRRQRMVITSLIDKARAASLSELNSMLDVLLPYVKTNLSKSEIVSYAMQAIGSGWLYYQIKETTISDREVFRTGYVGRSSVVFIELPVAARRIQTALYGNTNIIIDENTQRLFSLL